MQKRNREVNVFSLSAIDLFCSGMGAIMVLTVILMPYYLRPETEAIMAQLAEAKAAVEQAQAQAKAAAEAQAQAQNKIESLEKATAALQSKLESPFLAIAISWGTGDDDVDLHVTDPQGREYYYKMPELAGSPAKLEVDSTKGPGNEVWIHPAATPGNYKVECVFYTDGAQPGPVEIRGVAVHRDGRMPLPTRVIRSADRTRKELMAILNVSPTGEVTIR